MWVHNFLLNEKNIIIMINMFVRSIIIYIFVLFAIRFMGKRQVGEMQPFEFVITLIIADLATIPMSEISVPIVHGIVPIFGIIILHYFICLLSRKSMKARYLISGRAAIVMDPNGINYQELKYLNMNLDDLIESLRCNEVYNLDDVAYAIIETNGKLSIIKKSQVESVTREDMKMNTDPASLPVSIIMDGRLMKENIKLTGISEELINESLTKVNTKSHKDILLMTIDANGSVFIQPKNGNSTSFDTQYSGTGKW